MSNAYNPDEFARAKHLVALAEQINTKINTVSARTSRPVSLAYKKSDNTYAQLDSAASALSIPFENLTAVLRIASGDEDIVPTITLSNNVTASTPTYSNGAFETTLTLPNASVTSFSMTIALPQTETFSAWQKTFNVTASDLIPRSSVAFYMKLGTGSETNITNQDEVTVDISSLTSAKSDTRFCMSLGYNDNTKSLTDINNVMSTWTIESDADNFTPNYQTTWVSADANGRLFYTTIALHQRVARDIALVLKVPAFNGYAPTSKSLTMHFVNGGD